MLPTASSLVIPAILPVEYHPIDLDLAVVALETLPQLATYRFHGVLAKLSIIKVGILFDTGNSQTRIDQDVE